MNDLNSIPSHKRACFPQAGKGVPQGSALSPLLSNFYLRKLDQDGDRVGFTAIRYADDIAVPCSSEEEAMRAYEWIQGHMRDLKLKIHPIGHPKSKVWKLGNGGKYGMTYLGFYLWCDSRGVSIKPSNASLDNALREVRDTFDPSASESLADRYHRLGYFLNSWVSTYAHVCDVKQERERLLEQAQRGLTGLLRDRHLLGNGEDLSVEQRRFLGVDRIFCGR